MQALPSFFTTHPLYDSIAAAALLVVLVIIVSSEVSFHRLPGRINDILKKEWETGNTERPAPGELKLLEDLDEHEKERLWQHGMHEDDNISDRSNNFTLFESILIAAVGAVYGKSAQAGPLLEVIAIIGLVTTLAWMSIQAYHRYYLRCIRLRLAEHLREYRHTVIIRRGGLWSFDVLLRTYLLPLAIAVIWLTTLAFLEGA